MILVIDNYDSFTYNLVQYLGLCGAEAVVKRNDEIGIEDISALAPAGILLSPGPCRPSDSGVCIAISQAALTPGSPILGTPLFGVCLGHQTIGMVSGATVARAGKIMHGKTSMVEHDGQGLFAGLPSPFEAVRYHSLTVRSETIPDDFDVTARATDDNEVMGFRHRSLPIESVQFHPESVLTDNGIQIVRNFVSMVG
ncbi:MAG: aminodeoxychorismate/anthranilate synthase component II [Armatimonadetes bacterium]|nr:aminodeoxychorismate/anthranilate synthase component II [Armatimonadota bacterium]